MMNTTTINLREYKAKDLITLLESYLQAAKQGDLQGFAITAELLSEGRRRHVFSVLGTYRAQPLSLLSVMQRLGWLINRRMDREDILPDLTRPGTL